MKFKYLIIAFSVIIVIIVSIAALLPLLITGAEFAVNFRYITLPLLLFTGVLLICMTIFFLFNYRLLSLLEREDWPALAYYLEQKVFVKNRYTNRYIRLLASSYLVMTDYQSVLKLESKAMLARPSVVNKNVLIFGAARVLSGVHKEAAAFFKSYMGNGNAARAIHGERQWIHWYYGFSQLLSGSFSIVEPEFKSLAISSNNALIAGLSAYFLYETLAKYSIYPEECRNIAENGRKRIKKALPTEVSWIKEADKSGTDMHIAIVRKYIEEAGKWIYLNRVDRIAKEVRASKPVEVPEVPDAPVIPDI